ncbi:hypothetical protein LSTR_LSTR005250 [Laodelphax striatellus]|uniref:Uncharacterized protein n=1 Tax=Laodelphax striatellus TaxID=195883 RepID=A0A482X8H0_LAOST|nr:hypothetical protein LSTR_LSTR005250 [Laodelphax striatellus]
MGHGSAMYHSNSTAYKFFTHANKTIESEVEKNKLAGTGQFNSEEVEEEIDEEEEEMGEAQSRSRSSSNGAKIVQLGDKLLLVSIHLSYTHLILPR